MKCFFKYMRESASRYQAFQADYSEYLAAKGIDANTNLVSDTKQLPDGRQIQNMGFGEGSLVENKERKQLYSLHQQPVPRLD